MDAARRPAQLDSPIVARVIRLGSRLNTRLYRATGGRLGGTWRVGAALRKPAPVCLLTTIGRKSGEPRVAPLIYLQDGERLILVASKGGMSHHPAWYLNLEAHPDCEVELPGTAKIPMRAARATDEEKALLWPRLCGIYPDYDDYQARTTRNIPVLILTRR